MPTGRRLDESEELYAFHAMHVMLTKDRGSPDAKAVLGQWNRDWPVDADHSSLDVLIKAARSVNFAGKDRTAIRSARLKQVLSDHDRHCCC